MFVGLVIIHFPSGGTNRLYETVAKDLLRMDEMLRERAQKLKGPRELCAGDTVGARRQGDTPD